MKISKETLKQIIKEELVSKEWKLDEGFKEIEGLSETSFLNKGGVFDYDAWWDSLSDEKKADIQAKNTAKAEEPDPWTTSGEKPWRATDKEPKI